MRAQASNLHVLVALLRLPFNKSPKKRKKFHLLLLSSNKPLKTTMQILKLG